MTEAVEKLNKSISFRFKIFQPHTLKPKSNTIWKKKAAHHKKAAKSHLYKTINFP
jgi:hypothetical protein